MFGFIKKMLIVLLTSLAYVSSHTKYVSLNNQQCKILLTLINLHPIEYTQGLRYYPFVVNLDRYVGSCNTLKNLSNEIHVANERKDLKPNCFQDDYRNN